MQDHPDTPAVVVPIRMTFMEFDSLTEDVMPWADTDLSEQAVEGRYTLRYAAEGAPPPRLDWRNCFYLDPHEGAVGIILATAYLDAQGIEYEVVTDEASDGVDFGDTAILTNFPEDLFPPCEGCGRRGPHADDCPVNAAAVGDALRANRLRAKEAYAAHADIEIPTDERTALFAITAAPSIFNDITPELRNALVHKGYIYHQPGEGWAVTEDVLARIQSRHD